jgi:hypothetical protein
MTALKKKHRVGISREQEREEDRSKLGKEQFCRKQKNAAEHGARLKDWLVTDSRGDALQTPYFLNGMKGYSTTNNSRKLMQTLGSRSQT